MLSKCTYLGVADGIYSVLVEQIAGRPQFVKTFSTEGDKFFAALNEGDIFYMDIEEGIAKSALEIRLEALEARVTALEGA